MNELMIVNPSRTGAMNMPHHPYSSYGTGPHRGEVGVDWTGVGEDPYEPGAIPMDELAGHYCANCGGEQVGYYGDSPDRGLVNRYCPDCGTVEGLGTEPSLAEDLRDLNWVGDEEGTGPYSGIGEHYTEDDMDESVGYYGPYWDRPQGPLGENWEDGMGRYVSDARPSFNAECPPGGQLSGYQAETTVDPTCQIQNTMPTTPPSEVPDIFRPYL